MYARRTIATLVAITTCSLAFAQNVATQKQTPAQAAAQAQAQAQAQAATQAAAAMEQMLPMFERMMDAMVTAQARAAAKPEVAEGAAAFKRNLYEALRKKGFTAQEALQIAVATPLPSIPVSSK